MVKIRIKTMLKNKTENRIFNNECLGIKVDNKIKYYDNNVSVVISENDDSLRIDRTSKDYHISLLLSLNNETTGIYDITNLGSLELSIFTNKLIYDKDKIEIEYILNIDKKEEVEFYFYLEMEDVL